MIERQDLEFLHFHWKNSTYTRENTCHTPSTHTRTHQTPNVIASCLSQNASSSRGKAMENAEGAKGENSCATVCHCAKLLMLSILGCSASATVCSFRSAAAPSYCSWHYHCIVVIAVILLFAYFPP